MRPAKPSSPLLFLVLVLSLAQCSRGRAEPEVADRTASDGQPMELTEAGRERTLRDDTESAEPAVSLPVVDARDAAFSAHRLSAAPLYPVDFVIGPLRIGGLSSVERAARTAGRRTLENVLRTDEAPERGVSGDALGLSVVLAELAAEIPADASVRIGRPSVLASDEYSLPFRISSSELDWVGELVMETAEGEWYISDVQAERREPSRRDRFTPGGDAPGIVW